MYLEVAVIIVIDEDDDDVDPELNYEDMDGYFDCCK